MLSFFRRQAFEDPVLGRFTRVRTVWLPEKSGPGLSVTLEGDKQQPSTKAVEVARRLLGGADPLVQAATAFIQADAKAMEFVQGNGQLVCDGFSVNESGEFSVEFSLTEWPDAMISVPFVAGAPSAVRLGD